MLAIELGVREAARRCNLSESTVKSWSTRYKWLVNTPHPNSPKAIASTASKPAQILTDELHEHERETRMSLARSARKLATEAESANLRQVSDVHKVAQVMAIVHRQDQDKPGAQFSLNVLNLNMFSDDTPTTLDE